MKFDRIRQNYDCSFYRKRVLVHIKRNLCDRDEYCPEPQPHVMEANFDGCSDIFNCGVGVYNEGHPYYPKIALCPANRQLEQKERLD